MLVYVLLNYSTKINTINKSFTLYNNLEEIINTLLPTIYLPNLLIAICFYAY